MTIRARTLDPDETQKAIDAGGPLAEMQVRADRLKEMSIAVVEVDDQIVAYWVVWYALHTEPLWIHEDWRKSPAVAGGLIGELQRIVEATEEPSAFCVIEAENLERMVSYATRLGFYEAPGKLFYLVLEPAQAVVGG
jgi:hypothetical protein